MKLQLSPEVPFVPNYDESLAGNLPLPDVLTCADGERVVDRRGWEEKRRPELLELFAKEMFGRTPILRRIEEVTKIGDTEVFDGLGRMVQVALRYGPEADHVAHILYFLPGTASASAPVPCFLCLNFCGNHEVMDHPDIRIGDGWFINSEEKGYRNNRATEASRGTNRRRWPIESVLRRGYAVATVYYGDFDPDYDDGFLNGVHSMAPGERAGESWGAIGAWAWGFSLMADYLETLPEVDASKLAAAGHSRQGKTALWAGAQDERFSVVVSNGSGAGGASLSRRNFGESLRFLTSTYPHWFCSNFSGYSDNETSLPFDQHALIALMAPRPVYIASATDDLWADPKGEFLAGKLAGPVYALYGREGIDVDVPPPADTQIGELVGYHRRTGIHDILAYDWERFMDFAGRHWSRPHLP